MSETMTMRFRAAIVIIAPVVLLAGLAYHPYFHYPDSDTIAEEVTADTTRWGLAHLAVGVGSGLVVLAFLSIRAYLHEAGENRWSILALPFIVMGSTLFTILPGMEFAPLAAAETGGDVEAAQTALGPWFLPILLSGAVTFALGALGFAIAIVRSGVVSPGLTRLVAGALLVMAATRFVPLGAVQFYVQGTAAVVALWPLAYAMWMQTEEQPTGQPRPIVPSTRTATQ